jgi:hypothetical protein
MSQFSNVNDNVQSADFAWIQVKVGTKSGKVSAATHSTYNDLLIDDLGEKTEVARQQAAVEFGYQFLKDGLESYRKAAEAAGFVLP